MIDFIGVWNTVAAYGSPFKELTYLINRFVYPVKFGDEDLGDCVIRACHAISLDEERKTFRPIVWNQPKRKDRLPNEKFHQLIEQVWFAGVHANVGGGYPDDNLSLVALDWMISKVDVRLNANGLFFIDVEVDRIRRQANNFGKLYKSRRGLKAYYRYAPRKVADLSRAVAAPPKIHESVLRRIRSGAMDYAPLGIPKDYGVDLYQLGGVKQASIYETEGEAGDRQRAMGAAWRIVEVRRWLYLAFLIVTAMVVALPFVGKYRLLPDFVAWNEVLDCALQGDCAGYEASAIVCSSDRLCFLEPVIAVAGWFVPSIADTWVIAFRQNPSWALGFLAAFAFLFWLRTRLRKQIHNKAAKAWAHLRQGERPFPPDAAAPGQR